MYGSKNWALNRADRRLTEGVQMKLVRQVPGHGLYDHEYTNTIHVQLGILIYKKEYTNTNTSGMNIFTNGTQYDRQKKYAVQRCRPTQKKIGRFVLRRNGIRADLRAVADDDDDNDDDDNDDDYDDDYDRIKLLF
jgi:hypothetical protein